MRRPQFTLRALLAAMLVVAAFFGGIAWQRMSDDRQQRNADLEREFLELRVKMLQENNAVLSQELRSAMIDLMRAEAKAEVNAENAGKAAE